MFGCESRTDSTSGLVSTKKIEAREKNKDRGNCHSFVRVKHTQGKGIMVLIQKKMIKSPTCERVKK